jgi:hypothetical protein
MLYLYGETPLVNCGPRSILLHLYYHVLQALFTFRKYYLIKNTKNSNNMIINAHITMCSNRTYQLHIEMALIPLMGS